MQLFDFEYALSAIPAIAKGVPLSLAIAVVGFVIGSIFGLVLALCRIYKILFFYQ